MCTVLSYHSLVVQNQEVCPLKDSITRTERCSYSGKKIEIFDHNVTVTIPSGAIERGYTVEIQVAASVFGSYNFPIGYFRTSPYVWIGASYIFKKRLVIEVEHHAFVSEGKEISNICVLEVRENDHDVEHYLCEVPDNYNGKYGIGSSFYTYHTNSKHTCVAGKTETIPIRVAMYQYVPQNYMELNAFDIEICFCCNLNFFRKVCNCLSDYS